MKKGIIGATLVTLLLVPTMTFGAGVFTDVSEDDWYYSYVTEAKEMGIIDVYKDVEFKGEENVTRAELTKILVDYDKQSAKADEEEELINAISSSIPSTVKIVSSVGTGSGFFIKSNIILTNQHVVEKNKTVRVYLSTGQKLTGEVIATDSFDDIAIVKVSGSYNHLSFANVTKIGQTAIAIGNPLGLFSVTKGIVSNVNSQKIQVDTATNKGNSGGALIDSSGNVIGMIKSRIYGEGNEVEGMGYAVPTEKLITFLEKNLK